MPPRVMEDCIMILQGRAVMGNPLGSPRTDGRSAKCLTRSMALEFSRQETQEANGTVGVSDRDGDRRSFPSAIR